MSAKEILDTYFIENRGRLLEIAAFLDRIGRARDAAGAKGDFRYKAFIRAIGLLLERDEKRTKAIQLSFSDLSEGLIASGAGLIAAGAWEGTFPEDH
jgi:hypothetical protein